MAGKLTEVTANMIVELGKRGIDSFLGWIDRASDEIHPDDLVEYFTTISSLWGHAAQCDEPISEEEEAFVGNLIHNSFIQTDEELYISKKMLEKIGLKKKEMKQLMVDSFQNPMILKDICRVADELQEEEDFYLQACLVILCDGEMKEEEDQFLIDFADRLGLTKLDRKRILQNAIDAFKEVEEEEEE